MEEKRPNVSFDLDLGPGRVVNYGRWGAVSVSTWYAGIVWLFLTILQPITGLQKGPPALSSASTDICCIAALQQKEKSDTLKTSRQGRWICFPDHIIETFEQLIKVKAVVSQTSFSDAMQHSATVGDKYKALLFGQIFKIKDRRLFMCIQKEPLFKDSFPSGLLVLHRWSIQAVLWGLARKRKKGHCWQIETEQTGTNYWQTGNRGADKRALRKINHLSPTHVETFVRAVNGRCPGRRNLFRHQGYLLRSCKRTPLTSGRWEALLHLTWKWEMTSSSVQAHVWLNIWK